MAGFKTHITTSTVLGIGYGAAAYLQFGVPWDTCVLAGGLCSVSGMLPDVDSDSGVPLRESLCFGSAVVPMLMLHRFVRMGLTAEQIVLVSGAIYVFIRFVLGELIRKYTVHRGMFHSLPAALIAGELAFLICHNDNLYLRYYEAGGVVLGFMSHLVLDEIWSLNLQNGKLKVKKSFGTAIKLWGDSLWGNFSVYGKAAILTYVVLQDPVWMGRFKLEVPGSEQVESIAHDALHQLRLR